MSGWHEDGGGPYMGGEGIGSGGGPDGEVRGEAGEDEGRAPICPACGVTALPAETASVLDATFVCENPDCEAFGETV